MIMLGFLGIERILFLNSSAARMNLPGFCITILSVNTLIVGPVEVYDRIRSDLAEVQAVYDNEDSIIVLPVTSDYLRMMKIIGKNINLDVVTHSKNTLFF